MFGTSNNRVKERLLMKSNLTLKTAEDMCKATKISKLQIDSMTSTSQATEVHMVDMKQVQKQMKSHCGACGFTHVRRQCPTKGKTCDKCKGQNHFASVSNNKPNLYKKSRYTNTKKVPPFKQSSTDDYEATNCYDALANLRNRNTFSHQTSYTCGPLPLVVHLILFETIWITILDLEPNLDFKIILNISKTNHGIFISNVSNCRSGQVLPFIFFDLRALVNLWGRYG